MLPRRKIVKKYKLLCLEKNKTGIIPVMSRQ